MITKDITKEFGLDTMSESDQQQALQNVGQVVIQSAVLRVLNDMSEEDTAQFEAFLENDPSPEELIAFLTAKAPQFESILQEEVVAFKEEVVRAGGGAV